jgi:hypothetical protein
MSSVNGTTKERNNKSMNLSKLTVVALVALCIGDVLAQVDYNIIAIGNENQQTIGEQHAKENAVQNEGVQVRPKESVNQQAINEYEYRTKKIQENLNKRANKEFTSSKIVYRKEVNFLMDGEKNTLSATRHKGLLIISANSVTLYWTQNAINDNDYDALRIDIDINKISLIKIVSGVFFTSVYLINSDYDVMFEFCDMFSSDANQCAKAIANTRNGIRLK